MNYVELFHSLLDSNQEKSRARTTVSATTVLASPRGLHVERGLRDTKNSACFVHLLRSLLNPHRVWNSINIWTYQKRNGERNRRKTDTGRTDGRTYLLSLLVKFQTIWFLLQLPKNNLHDCCAIKTGRHLDFLELHKLVSWYRGSYLTAPHIHNEVISERVLRGWSILYS